MPPLRERKEDIHLLFRKFSSDFADKYKMPSARLSDSARESLLKYRWPGNIRQLKNVTEQLSVIEEEKYITSEVLKKYLPEESDSTLPILYSGKREGMSEREILYKVLFEMKKDVNDLKHVVYQVLQNGNEVDKEDVSAKVYDRLYGQGKDSEGGIQLEQFAPSKTASSQQSKSTSKNVKQEDRELEDEDEIFQEVEEEAEEESLSIAEAEKHLIIKALEKHKGKRKYAAEDLGVSERTLYRKIKEYGINK
jgi:DNA-binding NtrC family response regulator